MRSGFESNINSLKSLVNRFDEESNTQKITLLELLSKRKIVCNSILNEYVNALLFICAFPNNKKLKLIAESELKRITTTLKSAQSKSKVQYVNSGLPFTEYLGCFSHTFVSLLSTHPGCEVQLSSIENTKFDLNDILYLTLPPMERSITTSGYSNFDLMDALLVNEKKRLPFMLNELNRVKNQTFVKDFLYDGLEIYVKLIPRKKEFSKIYNRIAKQEVYYHSEIIKKFDHIELLNRNVAANTLNQKEKNDLLFVINNAMAVTARETDTVTYMDENSLQFYELERGLSVAIYGMISERQLPLESYVGYTLFKNEFPVAYGGAWVFGERADFGINIFDAFRGGESGYMFCQLLRVFRQVFQINYFLVEAFQYGLDNPEGIDSAAFWFYYRYGFKPLNKEINMIANSEYKKISASKKYRTSKRILLKFTESNIALNLGKKIPVSIGDITTKVRQMIQREYKGDREQAEIGSSNLFLSNTNYNETLNTNENLVLKEVALWANAFQIMDSNKLKILTQIIKTKPVDVYAYQQLILQFFKD